jgi:hypothetical protein
MFHSKVVIKQGLIKEPFTVTWAGLREPTRNDGAPRN